MLGAARCDPQKTVHVILREPSLVLFPSFREGTTTELGLFLSTSGILPSLIPKSHRDHPTIDLSQYFYQDRYNRLLIYAACTHLLVHTRTHKYLHL